MKAEKSARIVTGVSGVVLLLWAVSQSRLAMGWQYYQTMRGNAIGNSQFTEIAPYFSAALIAMNIYIMWKAISAEKGKKLPALLGFFIAMVVIAGIQSSYIPNTGGVSGAGRILGGMLIQVLYYIIPFIIYRVLKKRSENESASPDSVNTVEMPNGGHE